MEEQAGEEAAVVGGEGVGALGGERGEGCDEEGVALGEDVFEAGLGVEVGAEGEEGAGEEGEDVLVWGAGAGG